MPFRKLPNTDAGRVAALDALIRKADAVPEAARPYPGNLHTQAVALLAGFKLALQQLAAALSEQTSATARASRDFEALQMTASHYFQVLNLAIVRGVVPRSARAHYGLDVSSATLPPLDTHADVTFWAANVVRGEAARLLADPSAIPMAMPTAADVQAAATLYATSTGARSLAKDAYDKRQEDVAALRPVADPLIREIWDHIEFAHRTDPAPSRRRKCREWGITYVNRRGENAADDSPHQSRLEETSRPADQRPDLN